MARLASICLCFCLLFAGSVHAAPALPSQPLTNAPSPEVASDVEDYEAPAVTSPAAAASAVKDAAARIQDVLQDVPLEQTPLGMAAAAPSPSAPPLT